MRPPVKWHGGKYYLARRIVSRMPAHETYVEPFGGAASVLLSKEPAGCEVWNDIDGMLHNFFVMLRKSPKSVVRKLTLTPYSEREFIEAGRARGKVAFKSECARLFYTRCRQSLGGRGDAFSFTKHRQRRGMADVVSGWLSSIDENLPLVVERLRRVQFLCRPAEAVVRDWDSRETLFYCDPPYVGSTRASPNVYSIEMKEGEHRKLLKLLRKCKGKVMLSGYDNELYESLLYEWNKKRWVLPNNAAGGRSKRRMVECLWTNF